MHRSLLIKSFPKIQRACATWSAMVCEMSSWQNKTKQTTLLHHRSIFLFYFLTHYFLQPTHPSSKIPWDLSKWSNFFAHIFIRTLVKHIHNIGMNQLRSFQFNYSTKKVFFFSFTDFVVLFLCMLFSDCRLLIMNGTFTLDVTSVWNENLGGTQC